MLSEINKQSDNMRTNSEILEETYYEYHGKLDDGHSLVDELEKVSIKGVLIA